MPVKELLLRRPDSCARCGGALERGESAWWHSEQKAVTCAVCYELLDPRPSSAPDPGVAGASARRQYERKAARERRQQEARVDADAAWREQAVRERPVLGRVASALTPKPTVGLESQSTTAWKKGAVGEELVAEVLERCPIAAVLHDRRIPGSKANIDHIAVAPSGIYVIDAKLYQGEVTVRDVGSFFRPNERLYVKGRDRTNLVDGMNRQVQVVSDVLSGQGFAGTPIEGLLCFVGAEWSLLSRPKVVKGVVALWPKALEKRMNAPGHLTRARIDEITNALAARLRPN